MHRFLVAALAALVLPSLALVAGPATAGDLPQRDVSTSVKLTAKNRLLLKGDVEPGHANKPVFIQRRRCLKPRCDWRSYRRVETNDGGRFRAFLEVPRKGSDYYRARVRAHGGYAESFSQVWRVWAD